MNARDRVLDAGLSVMSRLGVARATTKEIARAADLSEAMIYRFFSDKTDLLLAVLKERVPAASIDLDSMRRLVGTTTVEKNLAQLTANAMRFYLQSFPIAMSLFSDAALLARHRANLAVDEGGPRQINMCIAQYIVEEQGLGRVAEHVDATGVGDLLAGAAFQHAFFTHVTGQEQGDIDVVAEHLVGAAQI